MGKRIIGYFVATVSLFCFLIAVAAFFAFQLGLQHPFFTLCGLLLPGVLLVSLFLLVLLLFYKSLWSVVPLLTLLISLPYLPSVFQFAGSSTVATPQDSCLTVCSYNVQGFDYGDTELTITLFADFLRSHRVQIACLQEMDDSINGVVDSLFKQRAGLTHRYSVPGNHPGFALSVYSSFPLIAVGSTAFRHSDNHFIWTDVVVGTDTLRVFNCHLQTTHFNQNKFVLNRSRLMWETHGEMLKAEKMVKQLGSNTRRRNYQTDKLSHFIRATPYPAIVCGDFNSTPASYTYWRMKRTVKDGFYTAGKGYDFTYRNLGKMLRVDYIFHSRHMQGLSYATYELDYSDHKPVVMKFLTKAR